MNEPSGDRRSRRSRKLLKQGLLELLREKSFSQISVRDITERMDMNRGTFYLHYPDTTALMRSIEEDMVRETQELVDAHLSETVQENTLRPVFEPILDYIVSHREACKALFDNNSSSAFLSRLQTLVEHNGICLLRSWYHTGTEEELTYLLAFVAYGLVGMMKTWFDRDMTLPKEDLIASADSLVMGAAQSLLGKSQ